MKRVQQSITGKGFEASERGEEPGDCFRACVASIFELPLQDVPNFAATGPSFESNKHLWSYAFVGWALWHGAATYELDIHDPVRLVGLLPGYSLLAGLSPRAKDSDVTPMRHVCVGWNGEIVWDPHPSGRGLSTIDHADFIIPITGPTRELLAKPPSDTSDEVHS